MANAKLLIVEDDEDRIKRLERLLARDYVLTFAVTAEQGIKEVDSNEQIDVAIIDWRLPIDGGFAAEPGGGLRVMKEIDQRRPGVPVIITYSWDTPEIIQTKVSSLKKLHVVDILEKPLLLDDLARSIERALPKRGVTVQP